VRELDDGHLVCAKRTFAEPLLAACQDVTTRLAPAA
jgi:hypothetical protein